MCPLPCTLQADLTGTDCPYELVVLPKVQSPDQRCWLFFAQAVLFLGLFFPACSLWGTLSCSQSVSISSPSRTASVSISCPYPALSVPHLPKSV